MSTPLALLFGSGIAWLDIIGLVTAVSMLEAALTGRGRTVLHRPVT